MRDASAFVEGPLPGGVRELCRPPQLHRLAAALFHPSRVGSTFVTVVPVYWDYQARADKDLPGGGRVELLAYGDGDNLEVTASIRPSSWNPTHTSAFTT